MVFAGCVAEEGFLLNDRKGFLGVEDFATCFLILTISLDIVFNTF